MTPTVGRIVHFSDDSGKCLAAIITAVIAAGAGRIKLVVFHENGFDVYTRPIEISEAAERDRWHWPELV